MCRFEVEDSVPLYRGAIFNVTVLKINISKMCRFIPEGNAHGLGKIFSFYNLLKVNSIIGNSSLNSG